MVSISDPLILGLHIGHDSGAAIIRGPQILAAVTEERFTRIKHYGYLPLESIKYCLQVAKAEMDEIDAIALAGVYFPKELKHIFMFNHKFLKKKVKAYKGFKDRIRLSLIEIIRKLINFPPSIPPLYIQTYQIDQELPIFLVEHHLAHAATAYYTSGFRTDNLIITADGIGDRISTAVWHAQDGMIHPLVKYGREGSLGWFYGIVTEALGWWIGNGEGKTMGLAAYGNPHIAKDVLIPYLPIYKNGHLKRGYSFSLPSEWTIRDTKHWHFAESFALRNLLTKYRREDLAASCQALLEEQMLNIASYWVQELDVHHLCSAGGVFLNVKMNQHLLNNLDIDDYYIFPCAGDGGVALGAALQAYTQLTQKSRFPPLKHDYLGPNFPDEIIETFLEIRKLPYEKSNNITKFCADKLAEGKIIGWFQGRMEYGPRALGNRSILMDPSRKEHKDIINNQVKFRDPWRPFCPSLLEESASEYLMDSRKAPYMIISFNVIPEKIPEIPAVVHVDGTARPQTVSNHSNPLYYKLLKAFNDRSSIPVLLNTSFNIKGTPIVCQPNDAIECFYNTGLDLLILNRFILEK
ncbi:MAG: carbamoyltransferase family protein [Candidatus Helarchaeota archaeon]